MHRARRIGSRRHRRSAESLAALRWALKHAVTLDAVVDVVHRYLPQTLTRPRILHPSRAAHRVVDHGRERGVGGLEGNAAAPPGAAILRAGRGEGARRACDRGVLTYWSFLAYTSTLLYATSSWGGLPRPAFDMRHARCWSSTWTSTLSGTKRAVLSPFLPADTRCVGPPRSRRRRRGSKGRPHWRTAGSRLSRWPTTTVVWSE